MTTIRPILQSLHSPDVFDLESFIPGDDACFGLPLQAMFGPEGADGEESFDMVVCTPKWLEKVLAQHPAISGHHYLFVREFNLAAIRSFLTQYALKCNGDTWHDVAIKLGRIGKWEFEDYTTFARKAEVPNT